ncbi:hypothetical protein ID866_13140 [Astraeus odoratus]|nr:hypothetical protein ID866_13140 [Astraeus odoratus]
MRSISSSQKENLLSMASNGLPTCHIASNLGLGKSTVSRILQDLLLDHPIPSAGHPTKLSSTDQHCILLQICLWNGFQCSSGYHTHQFHDPKCSLLTDSKESLETAFI